MGKGASSVTLVDTTDDETYDILVKTNQLSRKNGRKANKKANRNKCIYVPSPVTFTSMNDDEEDEDDDYYQSAAKKLINKNKNKK